MSGMGAHTVQDEMHGTLRRRAERAERRVAELEERIDAALFQITGHEDLYPRDFVADTLRGDTR